MIGGVFAVGAAVLSLSDRAPVIFRSMRSPARAVWRRIEVGFGFDSGVTRDSIPWASDEIGHLVLWGGGMVLVGLAFRHRQQADRLAVGLFAASVALEVLQALVTASRSLSLTDAAANGLGIMLGLTVVVAADLVLPNRTKHVAEASR